MPNAVTFDAIGEDIEEGAPKPAPKPAPRPICSRWIRTRRVLGFPLRFVAGLLKYLWHLAFAKRPIK